MIKKRTVWILGLVCSTYILCAASANSDKELYIASDNIVIDKTSNLIWQDTKNVKHRKYTWNQAVQYCQDLTLNGHSNWRLPQYEELLNIVDYQRFDPAILKVFRHVETSNNYWTNTLQVGNQKNVWIVYFYNGYTYIDDIQTENYVRCVHTI